MMQCKGACFKFTISDGKALGKYVKDSGFSTPTKADPIARRVIDGFYANPDGTAPTVEIHRKDATTVFVTIQAGDFGHDITGLVCTVFNDMQIAGLVASEPE